ncbi:unnamed protein product, partial [Polarella glacialis]
MSAQFGSLIDNCLLCHVAIWCACDTDSCYCLNCTLQEDKDCNYEVTQDDAKSTSDQGDELQRLLGYCGATQYFDIASTNDNSDNSNDNSNNNNAGKKYNSNNNNANDNDGQPGGPAAADPGSTAPPAAASLAAAPP